MSFKNKKGAIGGTGLVGTSTAFSLITEGVCDNILKIDINEEKAKLEKYQNMLKNLEERLK